MIINLFTAMGTWFLWADKFQTLGSSLEEVIGDYLTYLEFHR